MDVVGHEIAHQWVGGAHFITCLFLGFFMCFFLLFFNVYYYYLMLVFFFNSDGFKKFFKWFQKVRKSFNVFFILFTSVGGWSVLVFMCFYVIILVEESADVIIVQC